MVNSYFFSHLWVFSLSQKSNAPYKYPVTKGSVEWVSIKNYQSLRDVCQIPLDTVNRMTTEALFESVQNYPLIGDAFAF